MKIIEILPQMIEGGVERHIIMLTNELVRKGHQVMVISGGGKLVSKLNPDVEHWELPVYKKNPFTALRCSSKIADRIKQEGWNILHAHSRVPAWISMWAANRTGKPYVVTAHGNFGNKSSWIYRPYRKAAKVICVSNAVREDMKDCFYDNTEVIHNGMPEVKFYWEGPEDSDHTKHFLFIGRLSKSKGIHELVEIFSDIKGDWVFDVLGDGSLMPYLKDRIRELGLEKRVRLHGFRDDTDEWMRKCSCLLFPSYNEGMPLTLARAIQMRVPVIASNIPPVKEMALSEEGLLNPGDQETWKKAIQAFIDSGLSNCLFDVSAIPTINNMTQEVERIYQCLCKKDLDDHCSN
jgi:glycosyltransferase involved in cell wall biosynthesis